MSHFDEYIACGTDGIRADEVEETGDLPIDALRKETIHVAVAFKRHPACKSGQGLVIARDLSDIKSEQIRASRLQQRSPTKA